MSNAMTTVSVKHIHAEIRATKMDATPRLSGNMLGIMPATGAKRATREHEHVVRIELEPPYLGADQRRRRSPLKHPMPPVR